MINFKLYNFDRLNDLTQIVKFKRGLDTIRYYNYPFTFDIETTSFMEGSQKRACMYIWQLSINGDIIYGRTWRECQYCFEEIQERLHLDPYQRIIIYIHNLSYEFQFMQGHFEISEVFARKKRHPIKCLIDDSIELRCSYFLSGLSLEKLAENLTNVTIEKKVGQLDYNKIRHSKTPLTNEELEYCEYDVLILHYYILNEIEKNGGIHNVPLTSTGYVRNYCRTYIKKHTNYSFYRKQILKEAPTDKDLFIILNKAFMGGYVHANCIYIDDIVEDVYSIDFTSSYPAQMIRHKYPRGRFTKEVIHNYDELIRYTNTYACVFKIVLKNVTSKTNHHIWSSSKCEYGFEEHRNAIVDNGRISCTDEMCTFMTDVDFKIFEKFYNFDKENIMVLDFYFTHYGHLPKELIQCILDFYEAKTTLKGVEGKAEEYLKGKGMLNAIYGMCVTNPVNDDIIYDAGEWDKSTPEIQSAIVSAYNKNKQFLCYQWGVWVTAWARYELLNTVYDFGDDVLYCDTDSIKFINLEVHKKQIEEYNEVVIIDLENVLKSLGLGLDQLHSKDKEGEEHILGVWDYEGKYDRFKTLGAKRYAYEKHGELGFTISGLSNKYKPLEDCENEQEYLAKYKYTPMAYILEKGGLEFITDNMTIPKEYSSRTTHAYIEEYYSLQLEDYLHNVATVEEFCYIHLEKSEFTLGLSEDFIHFLLGVDSNVLVTERTKRDELAVNAFQRRRT